MANAPIAYPKPTSPRKKKKKAFAKKASQFNWSTSFTKKDPWTVYLHDVPYEGGAQSGPLIY